MGARCGEGAEDRREDWAFGRGPGGSGGDAERGCGQAAWPRNSFWVQALHILTSFLEAPGLNPLFLLLTHSLNSFVHLFIQDLTQFSLSSLIHSTLT